MRVDSSVSTVSSASPHGCGLMTIPGPPPYGASSTVRCRSWVKSRRSHGQQQPPAFDRFADQGQLQRLQVLREDRDDVNPHPRAALLPARYAQCPRPDPMARTAPQGHQHLSTGIEIQRARPVPVGGELRQRSRGSGEPLTSLQAHKLVVGEFVVFGRGSEGSMSTCSHDRSGAPGRGRCTLEAQRPGPIDTRFSNDESALRDLQLRARCETQLRLVR